MTRPSSDNPQPPIDSPTFWRSLADRSRQTNANSNPNDDLAAVGEMDGVARRQFLKLMAASMGLAGVSMSGCRRWPEQQVVPHNAQTEGTAPGRREKFATCWEFQGTSVGVIATSVDGRPIKIEGNPRHPFSLGAADGWSQASVLELYDPDRSRRITEIVASGATSELTARNWKQFLSFALPHFDKLRRQDGRGLAVVHGMSSSPTLHRLAQEWALAFPQSRWFTYEPIHRDNEMEGIRAVLGQACRPIWNFESADVVGSFAADMLGVHPGRQRWSRQWSNCRTGAEGALNRWYVAESSPSITGSIADSRLPIAPSRIPLMLESLAAMLGVFGENARGPAAPLAPAETAWLHALHVDLLAHRQRSAIVIGADLSVRCHSLGVEINRTLGNIGGPVRFTAEPLARQGRCAADMRDLVQSIEEGEVETLLILGGNLCFDSPGDARLRIPRDRKLTSIHLSLHFNETSAQCTWHVPMAHWLESWGDGRAWDGTYSVRQPLILPLFDGKSETELLATLLRTPTTDGRGLVRETCQQLRLLNTSSDLAFEKAWEQMLHDGVLKDSTATEVSLASITFAPIESQAALEKIPDPSSDLFELIFAPSTSVYDGRFANNGWLQELPDPITKLTWDNAAWIHPTDAAEMDLDNGDVIRLAADEHSPPCEIPVYLMPGQAPRTIGLTLGYGRQLAGEIGNRVGFDVYPLRKSASDSTADQARVVRADRRHRFAMTQDHHLIDSVGEWGREERVGGLHQSGSIVRDGTWEAFSKNPHLFQFHAHGPAELQLFDPPSSFSQPHAWGMGIDLSKCTGCSACVVACQAENNIPIVGKDQVQRNREMHWIRIDRYFKGSVDAPEFVHMPMTCHHCETAPCEQVCPVAATVHDSEGLNTMVYNRCIGTRYCSNNCPAKVRHFNFFDYQATSPREVRRPWVGVPDTQPGSDIDPLRRMQFNPDVTVRMRGVMEKCTFCTQRIQAAKIGARVAHAQGHRDTPLVKDGEVIPACAAACPTAAITFGDLNDANSQVARVHNDERAYTFLEELQLRPRTRYLAKLRNPLAGSSEKPQGGES